MALVWSRNDFHPLSSSLQFQETTPDRVRRNARHQRAARRMTDVYFTPPLDPVGLREWNRFDTILQQNYEHEVVVLAQPEVAGAFPRARGAHHGKEDRG